MKKVSMVNFRQALTFAYYGAFLVFIFLLLIYFKPDFLNHFWDSKIERVDIEIPIPFGSQDTIRANQECLRNLLFRKRKLSFPS